jgi:hypothetical protein
MIKSINEKFEVNNYPYGSLKCTATFSIEFSKSKGFRHIFQTINPKTGRVNNPKKGNYYDLCYMVNNEGFIIQKSMGINGTESINKVANFVSENFELFTPEQIQYFYLKFIAMLKLDMVSSMTYNGSKLEDLKPIYETAIKMAVKGCNEKTNLFGMIIVDKAAIRAVEIPDFKPFKVTTYEVV